MRRGPAFLLLAAMVVATCSVPAAELPTDEPNLAPAVVERDGVRVSLALEGVPVSGARSWVRARVENVGPSAVRWAGGGCNDPVSVGIDLAAAFDRGREWPGLLGRFKTLALSGPFGSPSAGYYEEASRIRGQGAMPIACTADLRINELEPRGVLEMRAGWNGMIGGDAAPAPAGPAVVSASFPFIGIAEEAAPNAFDFDAKPIVVRIETHVIGGDGLAPLSPALAIDAALRDAEFAAFVEAAPEQTWINPHLLLEAGVWGVGLFRLKPGGGGELFGEVKVDADGRVIARTFEP